MIKTLQPSYVPPTRQVLSGTLLEAEFFRTNIRVFNELTKESNCTIGKILILPSIFLLILSYYLFFKNLNIL